MQSSQVWTAWSSVLGLLRDPPAALVGSGVYGICMLVDDHPVPVRRLGGVDADGVLYIGQAISLSKDLTYFVGGGRLPGRLYRAVSKQLREEHPGYVIGASYRRCDRQSLSVEEDQAILTYVLAFLEPPPLNKALPYGSGPRYRAVYQEVSALLPRL